MQPVKLLLILGSLVIASSFAGYAQSPIIDVSDTAILNGKSISLEKTQWRFTPSDDSTYALPGYADTGWVSASIKFGQQVAPPGWKGYGWFRIWIKKNKANARTLGLRVNQDGASVLYLDGQRIGSIGSFATNAEQAVVARAPYTIFPLSLTDTLPHLLAVRYCNFDPAFSDFAGLQAWLSDMHTLNERAKKEQQFYDRLLISVAIQMMLVVVHLLLFLFYPRQKVHLYYSLFVSVTAMAGLARVITIVTDNPHWQYTAYQVFFSMMTLIPFTGALLFYQVSLNRIPRRRLGIVSTIMLALLVYFFSVWSPYFLINDGLFVSAIDIFTTLVFIDGTLMIGRAIRNGNKRLWLIAIAMCVSLIASVVVGSNLFNWFNLPQVMGIMHATSLLLPVFFSVYLALQVADTNRNLEQQLLENKRLAQQVLAREQEKNKWMQEQAERLEQTVAERTEQVQRQADQLREMDRVKSRFFVNLTHEFKTPLTLIMNPARELLQISQEALTRQYAGFIVQNSERLQQLINQLLDLSKLENGQPDIVTQPLELVKWTRNHIALFQSLAQQKNIRLSLHSSLNELWIEADTDKLEKMLHNLLSNAIKFSHTNGQVEVQTAYLKDNRFTIAVKDQGIGIPASKLPYIFDRFYQVDASDTRSREGAGIGLSLTKELARLLGGEITVQSEEGHGSCFVLTLPYEPAMPDEAPTAASAQSIPLPVDLTAAEDRIPDGRPLILIVEDNPDLRLFMSLSLGEKYQVLSAGDGAEGTRLALEQIPSIIITDIMMPERNGYELCEILKTDDRSSHIPVIVLTAKADHDSRILGIETGADAYLAKPFDKRELIAVTENLLRNRQHLREKYSKDPIWLSGLKDLPSMEQAFIEKVRTSIAARLDDPGYGADQLAGDLALSRTQLHRKLKQVIDQSPGELIRIIRMQRAHALLQNRTATVAEVAYMVGYGNPANFSTSFSRHFGYPPGQLSKASS
ncbi:MAG: response regulator [Chitinophagaceae bacterium]|nr:response regulator [Chitinophagaceae bacterium]